MLLSRSDRGLLAQWWFTVDRALMTAVLLLMAMGVLIAMAASPPVAERIGLDSFHFVKNQLLYLVPAVPLFIGMSFLTPAQARRSAFVILAVSLALMAAALVWGPEVKGAQRWINVGSFNLQPSELVKPAFVVIVAWFLAEHTRRPEMPGHVLSLRAARLVRGSSRAAAGFWPTVLVIITFAAMLLAYGIS
jgi:cell division protein FtsW